MFCYKKSIETVDLPEFLTIPLWRGGQAAVTAGDEVRAGDIIGHGASGLPVYAPLAGRVTKIGEFSDLAARPQKFDFPRLTVYLQVAQPQGESSQTLKPWPRFWENTRQDLGYRIWQAGIKDLRQPPDIELLIFDGLNLEPPISNNIRLLRETPQKLIEGMRVLMQLHRSVKGRIILSPEMPDLINNLKVLLTSSVNISVEVVTPRYPQGNIKLLKDHFATIPSSGVYGMEAVWNIRQAVFEGRPLTSKLCTVWDQTTGQSSNLRLPLGINIGQVLKRDLTRYRNIKLILGGLITGRSYYSPQMPITAETDGVIILKDDVRWEKLLCINCGECANICPVDLMPADIYSLIRDDNRKKLGEYRVAECLECGLCSYICPSRIHLLHQIQVGKAMMGGLL